MINNKTPRIFCINLDRSKERWEKMEKQEKKQKGIKIERISGVDGFLIDKDELYKSGKITSFCYHMCSSGMIGCWLSHLKIWKKIVDEGLEYAVVLEDDAQFPDEYGKKMRNILGRMPGDVDILLLGCLVGCRDSVEINLLEGSLSLFYKPRGMVVINEEIIIPRMFIGSYAYLITNKGARKCLNLFSKVNYHIDHEISRNQKLNLYAVRKQNEWFKTFAASSNSTLNNQSFFKNNQNEKSFLNNNFSIYWILDAPIAQIPFSNIIINGWLILQILFISIIFIILRWSRRRV